MRRLFIVQEKIPCLRRKSRKTYPGWPHVPIKHLSEGPGAPPPPPGIGRSHTSNIVPRRLVERVWSPIFQSPGHPWIFTSVPKGFQSSLLLIHLRSQYLFKQHQRVAQNLSDRWCSTQVSRCSTISAAQLRSVTEIAPKSPLLLWKEALSGLVFVPAQELSGYSVPQCAWDSTLVLRSLWCLSISVVLRYLDRALPCWVHPNCSVFWYFPHTSVSSFVFWVLEDIFLCRWKGELWSLMLFPSSSILNPPSFLLVFQKTGELGGVFRWVTLELSLG